MSKHVITGYSRRIASLATAGTVVFGGVALMAPTAAADDLERTPTEVIERIEAQDWPRYSVDEPGPSVDVIALQYFLNHLGYVSLEPTEEFTEEFEEVVLDFEENEGIDINGEVDSQDWIKVRNLHFPTEADAYQEGDRGFGVVAVQALLNEKFDAGLDLDGRYEEDTVAAVEAAQEELGIGVDGAFGWLSYRGVITHQNGGDADARAQAPVEEAPAEQAPAEDAEGTEDAERAEGLEGQRGY